MKVWNLILVAVMATISSTLAQTEVSLYYSSIHHIDVQSNGAYLVLTLLPLFLSIVVVIHIRIS